MSIKRLSAYLSLALCSLVLLVLSCVFVLLNTASGARWLLNRAVNIANEQPGLTLDIQQVEGSITGSLILQGVEFQSADSLSVSVSELQLDLDLWALLTSRTLHLAYLSVAGVSLQTYPSDNENSDPPQLETLLQPLFNLPVTVVLDEVVLGNLEYNELVQVSANLSTGLLDSEKLHLDSLALTLESNGNQFQFSLDDFTLQSDFYTESTLQWQAVFAEAILAEEIWSGQLSINGTLDNLVIDHALESPLTLSTSGAIQALSSMSPEFALQHSTTLPAGFMGMPAQLSDIDLQLSTTGNTDNIRMQANMLTRVADIGAVQTELQAIWDAESGSVVIDLLEIDREGDNLTLTGELALNPVLELNADWQINSANDLPLPAAMVLNSVFGEGSLNLTLGENAAGLPDLDLSVSQLSGMLNEYQLVIDGSVTLADNNIQQVNMNLVQQNNRLNITGDRSIGEEIQFALELPSLQTLLPELQGQLSGSGTLAGSVESPVLNATLNMSEFSYPAQELALQQLTADLYYASETDMELAATVQSLSYGSLPDMIDSIVLTLSGNPASHEMALELVSVMADLTLSGRGQLSDSNYQLEMDTAQLASIYGDWTLQDQTTVSYTDGDLSVSPHCWEYSSLAACLSLTKPASTQPEAEFSLDGIPLAWLIRETDTTPAELTEILASVPARPAGLSTLQQDYNIWLPEFSFLDGTVSISGRVEPGLNDNLNMFATLAPGEIQAGLIQTDENAEDLLTAELSRFDIRYDEFTFSLVNGDMDAAFAMNIVRNSDDAGLAQGLFNGTLGMDSNQQLRGILSFDFPDLAWTESLISILEDPAGDLNGEVQLAGSLDQPRFISTVSLSSASTLLPEYGLNLTNINATLTSEDSDQFRFSLQGQSGDGQFFLDGNILEPLLSTRSLQLSLTGENVEAVNLPDTRVVISPELIAELSSNELMVIGTVDIPTLILTLDEEDTNPSKTSVSRDVIVRDMVQDETLRIAEETTSILRIPVNGNVSITLGDDVRFSGYGLNMGLTGSVDIEKTPDRPVLANGELRVTDGSYEFYGQRLTTENGHVLFIGNPANPALDVRAIREVDDITVGMQISGTLTDIQGQLFSSPTLPESEILAMLITGKSLSGVNSQEGSNMMAAVARFGIDKGQGLTGTIQDKLGLDALELNTGRELTDSSVGLGKYLTPDLYMSYKIGLFDNESVLSLDYTLTNRLKLEVETGISQSVDLTYSVEK